MTPEILDRYCRQLGLKPFPGKVEDPVTGDERYSYFLSVRKIKIEGEEVQEQNLIAAFGTFKHYPKETGESCLKAIWAIARHFKKTPQQIVEEIEEFNASVATPG